MTYDEKVRFLREQGCKCPLYLRTENPEPFTRCEFGIKATSGRECHFIQSLLDIQILAGVEDLKNG